LIGAIALTRMLIGLVMADDATCAGAEQTVVTNKMPRDPTNDRALQTTFGWGGAGIQCESDKRSCESRGYQYSFHVKLR